MSARECVIPVFVPHLGCRHECVFCNQRRISGSEKAATAATVKQAIEQSAALPRSGAKRQLAFYGGSFTAIEPERQEEELGAQSMDGEVLRLSGRGHTAENVVRSSEAVKAAGFRLILQMMTGLPGDSAEKDIETAKKLIALRPDGVRIYPTVIVRDTALYDLWRAGEYREHTVEDAVAVCAQLMPLFEEANIPVIRLGLNPTEELSQGAAVAGAYHPALGELVRSRILLEKARALLAGTEPGSRVTLGVNAAELSQMIGQKRQNVRALSRALALEELRIRSCKAERGEIVLLSIEKR